MGGRRRARVGPGGAVVSSLSARSGGVVRNRNDLAGASRDSVASRRLDQDSDESNVDPVRAYKERKAAARRQQQAALVDRPLSAATAAAECNQPEHEQLTLMDSSAPLTGEKGTSGQLWLGATPRLLLQEWMQRQGWRGQPRLEQHPNGVWHVRLGKGHVSGNAKRSVPIFHWNSNAILQESEKAPSEERMAALAALWVLAAVDRTRNHALRIEPLLRPYWTRFVAEHQANEERAKLMAAQADAARREAITEAKAAYRAAQQQVTLRLSERTRAAVEEALVLVADLDASDSMEPSTPMRPAENPEIYSWLQQELERLGFSATASAYAASRFSRLQGEKATPRECLRGQALDWLCLHLDEDELPPLFQPEKATEIVHFGQSDGIDLVAGAVALADDASTISGEQLEATSSNQGLHASNKPWCLEPPAGDLSNQTEARQVYPMSLRGAARRFAGHPAVQLNERQRQAALDWLANSMAVMSQAQSERLLLANYNYVLDAAYMWIRELLDLMGSATDRLEKPDDAAIPLALRRRNSGPRRMIGKDTGNDNQPVSIEAMAAWEKRERECLQATFGEALSWTNVLPATLAEPLTSMGKGCRQGFRIQWNAATMDGDSRGLENSSRPWGARRLCGLFYGFPETLPILWLEDWPTTPPLRYLRRCWLRSLHRTVKQAMERTKPTLRTQPDAVLAPALQTWLLGWRPASLSRTPSLVALRLCSRSHHERTSSNTKNRTVMPIEQQRTGAWFEEPADVALDESSVALDQMLQRHERARIQALHRQPPKPWLLLPARQSQQALLSALESGNGPLLIQAETGSGKTTQCPAMILEHALLQGRASRTFILVTQPRRIAAIAVAKRVAQERGESCSTHFTDPNVSARLNVAAASTTSASLKPALVGYQVRLQAQRSRQTRLLFCTTGIVLRMLQQDPQLRNVSHLILDEVHERNAETDLLLCCARALLQVRSDLQVILMSATVNIAEMERYWRNDSQLRSLRVLNIPGRSFPVEIRWLDDLITASKQADGHDRRLGRGEPHRDLEYDEQDRRLQPVSEKRTAPEHARHPNRTGLPSPSGSVSTAFEKVTSGLVSTLEQLHLSEGERAVTATTVGETATTSEHAREDASSESLGLQSNTSVQSDSISRSWAQLGFSRQNGASLELVELVIRRLDAELTARERQEEQGYRGAILVFLAGIAETEHLCRRLKRPGYCQRLKQNPLGARQDAEEETTSFWALALHANQSPAEQERIFASLPDTFTGRRKVICATNIAESSITVPDVVAVVDTCRVRSPQIQQAELSALELRETWCSKASAAQRAGRAGRVCSGICWRLIPREPVWNQDLPDTMPPELIRTPLERWLLWLLSWKQPQNGRRRTLAQVEHLLTTETLTPAPEANVQAAVRRLWRMGALTSPFPNMAQGCEEDDRDDSDNKVELAKTERRSPHRRNREAINDSSSRRTPTLVVAATWTPLGRILAALPIDPAIGKLLVYGAVFGCLAWSLTAAAVLMEGSPFQRVLVDRDAVHRAREQAYGSLYSDVSSAVYAWQQWAVLLDMPAADRDGPLQELLQRYGLSERTLESIRQTRTSFERLILDMGFGLPDELVDWHEHETHTRLHRAVLFAALFPHLIRVEPPRVAKYVSVCGGHIEQDESSPQALRLYDENGQRVWLHPSSLAWGNPSQNIRPVRWLTYAQRLATTRPYVQQVTCVPVFAVLLFAGHEIVIHHEQRQVLIDGWIRFRCAARTASLLKAFRQQIDAVLSAYFAHMAGQRERITDSNWPVRCRALRSILVKLVDYD